MAGFGKIVFSLAMALSSFAHAQQMTYVDYLPLFDETRGPRLGLFNGSAPSFDDLARQSFGSPADVLEYLIDQTPALRNTFILVHSSQSQQPSSLEHPRLILFGGGSAFAFSEHPMQTTPRVEVMEIDRTTLVPRFREIRFGPGGAEFDREPKSCASCHGESGKPLWNPYDFWPHAFASAIGSMHSKEEAAAYARLRSSAPRSGLLRQLELPSVLDRATEDITAFTEFVHQANLARWVRGNLPPSLDGYEKTLAAVLSGCTADFSIDRGTKKTKFLELFRTDERARVGALYDVIEKDSIESRAHFKKALDATSNRIFPNATTTFPLDHSRLQDEELQLAQIRTIFALARVDLTDFSTSLVSNDFIISAPSNSLIDFGTALAIHRPDIHAGLRLRIEDLYTGRKAFAMVDCASAKDASLKAPRPIEAPAWASFRDVHQARPVVSRCAKCHVEHLSDSIVDRAPTIPFDQPVKMMELIRDPRSSLAAKIKARIRSRGSSAQMPPDHPLTDTEIGSIEAYLEALDN